MALLALSTSARAESPTDAPVPVPEPSPKALRFYHSGNRFWLINQLWAVAVPAAILASGLSARLRTAARRAASGRWMLTISIYGVMFLGLNFLIDLPLDFCQSYIRPHAYGLSNQSPARWLEQGVKGLFVAMVGTFLLLWIPYLLMVRSPRRWWLYAGLLAIPFGLFGALIQPVLIDPLFHHYSPMNDKVLEARILDLAARAGIDGGRVFEVDMSRDTEAVNAYVKGFLGTHRIVLWDTLLAKLEPDEVLFVMAHEMGHYALGHVVRGIIVSALLTTLGLFLVDRAARWSIARWSGRFGFDRLSDVASLPLVMVGIQVVGLALFPAGYAFSRYQEHEADRFALELTRANRAGALGFVALQRENLSNPRPGPLYKLWRATHPSLAERIEFCNQYRPWHTGQPLRYADRFRTDLAATSPATRRAGKIETKDFGDSTERSRPD